jgi:AcrR family transcriptional regulator
MRKPHIDIGPQRRAQIVEAAVAVIAEKGLDKLTLAAIEEEAEMSRGQLTYYFASREDILLAVFDRMLEMMRERASAGADGHPGASMCQAAGWERIQLFLTWFVLQPPDDRGFHALQHTFLSQIGHRDDFRRRLASLYEEWRRHVAADVEQEQRRGGGVSARTVASFIQAVLHGLAMQRAADPDAYDRPEMLRLCLDLLGGHLRPAGARKRQAPAPPNNGRPARRARRAPKE